MSRLLRESLWSCAQASLAGRSRPHTLKKLCEKGFAKNENTVVTAVVKKEDVVAYASDHFVKQTFGGSLPQFLVAFLGGRKISEEEAEELKKLIDEHK